MEIAGYVRVLFRRWSLILIAVALVTGATYVLTAWQRPIYQSQSSLMVTPSSSLRELGSILQGLDTLDRGGSILGTYRALVTSENVMYAAARNAGISNEELGRYTIIGENSDNSTIITIKVTGPDPQLVNGLNNQLAAQMMQVAGALYLPYNVQVLDRASGPAQQIYPQPGQNMMLGAILGLVLGLVLVFLVEYLRMPEEVALEQNIIDPVSGVYNRTYFMQRLSQELARCEAHNYALSVALLQIGNLDQLKRYRAPDARNLAMRQVACFLVSRLRQEDLIAQVGRDQFAILFPDLPSRAAEEILNSLQGYLEWFAFDIEPQHIRLSVRSNSGLISYGTGLGADDMMTKAEQALKLAGTNGHHRVCLWQEQEVYTG